MRPKKAARALVITDTYAQELTNPEVVLNKSIAVALVIRKAYGFFLGDIRIEIANRQITGVEIIEIAFIKFQFWLDGKMD
jgi:hypothetical protein